MSAKFWLKRFEDAKVPYSRIWGHFDLAKYYIVLPFWFLIAITAAVATTAWRRWQYSLRSLLTVMTLLAMALALHRWLAR